MLSSPHGEADVNGAPPDYDEIEAAEGEFTNRTADGDGDRTDLENKEASSTGGSESDSQEEAPNDMEYEEINHPVSRSDTLFSIARRYAVDVRHSQHLRSAVIPADT